MLGEAKRAKNRNLHLVNEDFEQVFNNAFVSPNIILAQVMVETMLLNLLA